MKRIIFFVFISLLSLWPAGAQTSSSAEDMLKEACKKAGKENKNVIVIFTASWCGWCHRMKNSMHDEDIKKYFEENFVEQYYVVDESADKKALETPGAAAFRKKYGGEGQGIPFWLLFDKEGNLLADSMRPDGSTGNKLNVGCPADEPEVSYFISVLKKTTRLKEDQLEKISKRFRKNMQ